MKRRLLSSCLALSLVLSMTALPVSAAPPEDPDNNIQSQNAGNTEYQAVYLGVQGYGTVTKDEKESFVHRFSVDGTEMDFTVATGEEENYVIQNVLSEGYVFDITVEDGVVTAAQPADVQVQGPISAVSEDSITVDGQAVALDADTAVYTITAQAGGAQVTQTQTGDLAEGETVKVYDNGAETTIYKTFVAQDYESPVSYTPGKTTLKNFLAAAMQPVGTALYIYGGSWDWQDVASSHQATTIGIPQTWIDFFQSQDADYTYRNNSDHAHSYYPHEAWNQYYFAGVDCSAYVAWAVYNTMNTQSGGEGYVMSSTGMAKNFAQDRGFGTWTQTINGPEDFHPGDVFSMNGHVWICLGVCEDGSLVILHSTPSDSRTGQPGGGVQISGVGESEDCQAVALAQKYMSEYFPAWSQRYEAAFKSYDDYTSFTGTSAGKFTWNLGGDSILSDPDGYADMSADEILADLFGETESEAQEYQAVYLGVQGYGTVTKDEKESFVHRFSVDGTEMDFTVATGEEENYVIQNVLSEGYVFDITVEDGVVTAAQPADVQVQGPISAVSEDSITVDGQAVALDADTAVYTITAQAGGAQVTQTQTGDLAEGETVKVYDNGAETTIYKTFVAQDYESPVSYTPGKTTLKNFLAAAMQPVGTALYIYGGSWDWQDVASSHQATTIGIPQTWIDFFQSQDADYTYRNNSDHAHSYYPHEAWNQYYFAGVDCSAYVAWAVYNTMNTQSGGEGYVMSSTGMAKNFAQDRGFGTWTQTINGPEDFHPGDVFSMNGHVWICLGVCEDGSLVILHSTPSDSRTGQPGGGVQISGVGESEDCQAVALAQKYMSEYFPAWSQRYEAAFKSYDDYTSFTGTSAGKFTWNLGGDSILSDPDGYADMTADEILADLFDENDEPQHGGSGGGSSGSSSGVTVASSPHGRVTVSPTSPRTGSTVVLTPKPDEGYQLASITVVNRSGKEISLTQRSDGTYTYTQPSGRVTVRAEFELIPQPEPEVPSFQDVHTGDWYYDAVVYVAQRGLMSGTAANTFSPDLSTTRGMVVTILYSLEGKPSVGAASFQDVAPSAWYAPAVAWASANGIVSGYSGETFGPEDPITREQMAAILYRYAQYKDYDVSGRGTLSSFQDAAQLSDYAQDAMAWALDQGLISGVGQGMLAPQAGATRGQVAVILSSFCQNVAE